MRSRFTFSLIWGGRLGQGRASAHLPWGDVSAIVRAVEDADNLRVTDGSQYGLTRSALDGGLFKMTLTGNPPGKNHLLAYQDLWPCMDVLVLGRPAALCRYVMPRWQKLFPKESFAPNIRIEEAVSASAARRSRPRFLRMSIVT